MSLESFFGLDNADGQVSAEAAEKFREQMRKSAAAAKAIGAHQTQQKKKEDKLAKIFVKFLQSKAKSDLIFLVVRLMEENVPGAFILAILLVSDPELEKDLEVDLSKHAKLMEAKIKEGTVSTEVTGTALTLNIDDQTLPQNIKAELNAWGEEIIKAGLLMPRKTMASILTSDDKLKSIVLDLLVYSLDEYFDRHGMVYDDEKIRQFALLSIQTVLIKLREAAALRTDEELIEMEVKESAA